MSNELTPQLGDVTITISSRAGRGKTRIGHAIAHLLREYGYEVDTSEAPEIDALVTAVVENREILQRVAKSISAPTIRMVESQTSRAAPPKPAPTSAPSLGRRRGQR